MIFLYLIIFSLLPGIAWLIFFLREDAKPEPKKMIAKVFLLGMVATLPVISFGLLFVFFLETLNLSPFVIALLATVLFAAIFEEVAKYLVVKLSVLKSSECDEPTDIMIYAITAAMGFATLENVLFLLPTRGYLGQMLLLPGQEVFLAFAAHSFLRFLSGTFLHALVSGLMGYFLALSILETKKSSRLIITGLLLAILLHGLYNFFIIISEEFMPDFIVAIPIILITLFAVIFVCFKKLRKTASICKIDYADAKKTNS